MTTDERINICRMMAKCWQKPAWSWWPEFNALVNEAWIACRNINDAGRAKSVIRWRFRHLWRELKLRSGTVRPASDKELLYHGQHRGADTRFDLVDAMAVALNASQIRRLGLWIYRGMEHKEIAKLQGVTREAVSRDLGKARRKLTAAMA